MRLTDDVELTVADLEARCLEASPPLLLSGFGPAQLVAGALGVKGVELRFGEEVADAAQPGADIDVGATAAALLLGLGRGRLLRLA